MGEQGELTEHLALEQQVEHLALVDQFHGALAHDVHGGRGVAALLQDHGAGGEVLDLDRTSDIGEPFRRQRVERRVAAQEPRDVHAQEYRR